MAVSKFRFVAAVTAFLAIWTAAGVAQTSTTQGATTFAATNSSQVVNVQQGGSGYGLRASTSSTGPAGAIFGQATGTSGFNNGVWGRTYSPAGVGVRGEAMANTGGPTGVAGFSDFSFGGIGIYGHAKFNGYGVFGQIDSLDFSGAGVLEKQEAVAAEYRDSSSRTPATAGATTLFWSANTSTATIRCNRRSRSPARP